MQLAQGIAFSGDKGSLFTGEKVFFSTKQRGLFSEDTKHYFPVKILEVSVENGKKRRSVAFFTEPFFDLSYKKKRKTKIFYWNIFSNFCIRNQTA
jgi:hypothetical protein